MDPAKIVRRFLVPSPVVSVLYYAKYRGRVSPRAEVEFTPNIRLGKGVQISSFTKIKASGLLIIGDDTSVASGSVISAMEGGIRIGRDCLIGHHVSIVGNTYVFDALDTPIRLQGTRSKGITIGNNVLIGSSSTILDGAELGDGVIVSPHSVVSSQIPGNTVIHGNPAKVIFTRR